jgi:hypothetical protein
MSEDILFSVMTEREAVFFSEIAKRLRKDGFSSAFVAYHEAAERHVENAGFPSHSLHKLRDKYLSNGSSDPMESAEKEFGLDHFQSMYRHEMLTTRRRDDVEHQRKSLASLRVFQSILSGNRFKCVIQELGGFIAPQALFYAARKYQTPQVFIEPAMFPKRVVFTCDSFYSDIPSTASAEPAPPELKPYVENYFKNRPVVIPHKDRVQFTDMTLRKLFSFYNFKRLFRKAYHKYVTGEREEYNALGSYVFAHVMRWYRRKILAIFYQDPKPGERYVYFPLHVPLDFQLTVRCPEFLNQEAIIEQLASSLPIGYKLYVKEHPAAIGSHSLLRFWGVLRALNTRLIHPRHNSFDLIRNAQAVITINSKVGSEALLQTKPLLVLGKTYYRGKGLTVDVANLAELPQKIREVLEWTPRQKDVERFLTRVWNWSYPGELYETSPENLDKFYLSLRQYLATIMVSPQEEKTVSAASSADSR